MNFFGIKIGKNKKKAVGKYGRAEALRSLLTASRLGGTLFLYLLNPQVVEKIVIYYKVFRSHLFKHDKIYRKNILYRNILANDRIFYRMSFYLQLL